MHKKIPKICTGCRVSEAKIYLYHSTEIAKARPHSEEWQTDTSVQKQWSMTNRLKKQFWSSDFFWRKVNNFPCSLMPWFHYTNNFNKVIIFASFCFSFFISLGIRLVVFWTAFLGPFFSSRVRSCNSSTLIRCTPILIWSFSKESAIWSILIRE